MTQTPTNIEVFHEIYELAVDALQHLPANSERDAPSYARDALALIKRLCEHPLEQEQQQHAEEASQTAITHRRTAQAQRRARCQTGSADAASKTSEANKTSKTAKIISTMRRYLTER